MIKNVRKGDGSLEEFIPEKLNRWGEWASETCDVSWPDVVLEASRSFYEEISTKEIQKSLIDVCINRKDTGHSRMAARLLIGEIYKQAFEDFSIPDFADFYHHMVENGFWDDLSYTEEELQFIESNINHTADFGYEYWTLKQFVDKYAISSFKRCLESPQMALMGAAMSNTKDEENRAVRAVEAYNELSELNINLPTPSLAGQRTVQSGSPSCCVITGGDSVDSIEAAVHVAYKMTAMSSGIGAEIDTRSPKDPVKQGTIEHMGKMAYLRYLDRAVKANKQSTRGGSATVTIKCIDPEIETLLRLKSQRVHHDVRIDSMDYSLAYCRTFLKRAALSMDWPLVSVYHAPKLHELLYSTDSQAFEAEMDRILADDKIKKIVVKARDILRLFFTQRSDVGRIYKTNLTNINHHTPFKDIIRLSNLCQEVLLPTASFTSVSELYKPDGDGEVALCFLASIVAGKIKLKDDKTIDIDSLIKTAYQTAKFVDNTIEQSTYPFPAVERTAKARRSIGIGLTDVAHYMAKNGWKYDDVEGRNALHRLAEAHSFALHCASVQLAKERGKCEWFHKTKYSDEKPWLPIDTYAKNIDMYHSQDLLCDWEWLRGEIKKYGVRFSVHEAFMPVESSSVFTGSTNGLYPVRETKIYKKSPKGVVYFEAPGISEFGENYQNAYSIEATALALVYGIFQKFCGQSISADFYQILSGNKKISMLEMFNLIFLCDEIGMKTWYYLNTFTGSEKNHFDDVTEKFETADDEVCESCTL